MQNLIQIKNNEIVTTSLLVAEAFNKNHKDVMRKINNLIADIEVGAKLRQLKLFAKTEYLDNQNKTRPMYLINRDGFSLLAMGFTGAKALEWKLKYIQAFNDMEAKLQGRVIESKDKERLELAKILAKANSDSIHYIKALYPEYFSSETDPLSLEYASDVNTSYQKWIEDYSIDKDYVCSFPTLDLFNGYVRYCNERHLPYLGKKTFYKTLEEDFNLARAQRTNGFRYFYRR